MPAFTGRRRRGGNAIEFALCLPIWVLVMSAIMDFGWLFFHQSILDSAANIGCRDGSLVDPGDNDENIEEVELRSTARMLAVLAAFGVEDCTSCTVEAYTVGDVPQRTLVCEASREVDPLTGIFTSTRTLGSNQVSRLEWQREGAP